jgi:pseudomonalisin
MRRIFRFFSYCLPGLAFGLVACAVPGTINVANGGTGAAPSGETASGVGGSAPVAAGVDDTRRVTLRGNVLPMARAAFALGPLGGNVRLDRMMLLLNRSTAQQTELELLMEQQQDPQSAQYHEWLTPEEFGARFGASAADVARVSAWLAGQGLTVEEIPAGGRLIVFSGNAGRVAKAFVTEMKRYRVDGVEHIANDLDPQIPETLANVVSGVVSLHDFRRQPQIAERVALEAARGSLAARPQYSAGGTHYMFPTDFWAMYDLNPLFQAGTTGKGAAITIAARSNINLNDVAQFRATAGLEGNETSVVLAGNDPGLVQGDQAEATLDAEWAGAAAPGATVKVVVAPTSATTDGIDLAAAYIVNHALAPVVAISYGACEQQMGAAETAFYSSLWEQAAAQGMSVFVASGDSGAAGCSAGGNAVGESAAVNGMCSSPYATCVGGTQFNESGNSERYWAAMNGSGYASALGYIPEVVWNESALEGGAGLWASGGGVSTVHRQPEWQAQTSGAGGTGGMRAVPDVSLAAGKHDGAMIVENGSYYIVSGTSVSAPAFAGIMALAVERQGSGVGNANPRLYAMAGTEGGAFHPTPAGNNSVPGVGGFSADGAVYNPATGLGSVDGAVLVNGWVKRPVCGTMRLVRTRCGTRSPRIVPLR